MLKRIFLFKCMGELQPNFRVGAEILSAEILSDKVFDVRQVFGNGIDDMKTNSSARNIETLLCFD